VPRLAVAVALVLITLIASPAPSVAQEPCTDVTIIGVPGSGQNGGTGPQVGAVVDRTTGILTAGRRTVAVEVLDYPAIDLARTLGLALFDGRYAASVASGVEAVTRMVDSVAASCPETVLVLVGYSQGAQVIRESVTRLTSLVPIAAVALLADPTSSVVDAVARVGAERAGDGSLGPVQIPAGYLRRTIDVCAAGDPFCGGGRLIFGAHSGGYGPPLSDVAAARIAVLASSAVAARAGYGRPLSPWSGALVR
jgi:cutinase